MPHGRCKCGQEHTEAQTIRVGDYLDPSTGMLDPKKLLKQAEELEFQELRQARRIQQGGSTLFTTS